MVVPLAVGGKFGNWAWFLLLGGFNSSSSSHFVGADFPSNGASCHSNWFSEVMVAEKSISP